MAVIDFGASPCDPDDGQPELAAMHLRSGGHPVSISLTDRRRWIRHVGIALTHKLIEDDPDGYRNVGRETRRRRSGDLVCSTTPFDHAAQDFLRAATAHRRRRAVCHLTAVKSSTVNAGLRAGLSRISPSPDRVNRFAQAPRCRKERATGVRVSRRQPAGCTVDCGLSHPKYPAQRGKHTEGH